jgi:hypothetical protein
MAKQRNEPLVSPRFEIIANQMMRGFIGGHKRVVSKTELETFKKRYKSTIEWVDARLPKDISIGVHGAVGKAVLWYGREKIEPFCKTLTTGLFNGVGDPIYVLYSWLMGRKRYNPKEAYRKTVTVIRYFLEDRPLIRIRDGLTATPTLDLAKADLFEWDKSYTMMLRNHWNKTHKEQKTEKDEIRMAVNVDEVIKALKGYDGKI